MFCPSSREKKIGITHKSVLNMASSDSQIDTPQRGHPKGPLTLAIFAAILVAIFVAISSTILNRPCKLLVLAESPEVYTGDLKSSQNRSKNRH